jgi:hypothetical protein
MFVQFAELPVFDQDRAIRFYVDHFHCQAVADVPMNKDGWRWLELNFPGAETPYTSCAEVTKNRLWIQSSFLSLKTSRQRCKSSH